MSRESKHVSIAVDRPAAAVYAFASEPTNLPRWAAGLAASDVEEADGEWIADSPMGRVRIEFVPRNEFGVLDHIVTLPSGRSVYNPLRVLPDGDSCEVVFTLRREPDMSDETFAADADAVLSDLTRLKSLVEQADREQDDQE